jgi:putative ABC transport system ATP-binding protein
VLLCDEPTGALDSKTGAMVIEAVLKINELLRTRTLVNTHNTILQDVAHRVLSFANGQISGERVNEARRAATELVW